MKILLVALFFMLSSASLWAQVPVRAKDQKVYADLTGDLYDEVMTMDAVKETKERRQTMIQQIQSALKNGTAQTLRFDKALSWSTVWPPQRPTLSSTNSDGAYQLFTTAEHPGFRDEHALEDTKSYIEARLGAHSAQMIRDHKIIPVVVGGNVESVPTLLKVKPTEVYKIASFYEQWGLEKYFVSGTQFPDGKDRLVYVVPPAKEYLLHYQYMLHLLTGQDQVVVRVNQDYKRWQNNLRSEAHQMMKTLGATDYVVTGYYNQWSAKEIEKMGQRVVESKTYRFEDGQIGKRLEIVDPITQLSFSVAVLGHEKTIWGEATSAMMEGAMDHVRRGVIFMGSAGAISPELKVYDISVPIIFSTQKEASPLLNFVQSAKEGLADVHFSAIHGNTASPAEQTRDYVSRHQQAGTDTFDVEQSLLAERVWQYNQKRGAKLVFGAINLITDKPFGGARNDLDNIDPEKKQKARLLAVSVALKAIGIQRSAAMACARVHR